MSRRKEQELQVRPGRRRWPGRLALLLVAVVVGYLGVTAWQVVRAADLDERVESDAIVVLGAAQYDGTPSPALQGRLDRALELYRAELAPVVVLTGAKQAGDRFTEAFAGFRYLTAAGVPESALRIVDDGDSSYESLAAAARVLRAEGSERVLLVTDRYHNRRVQGIARELGLTPYLVPTDAPPTLRQVLGETGRVAVGEVVGYRRLDNQTH